MRAVTLSSSSPPLNRTHLQAPGRQRDGRHLAHERKHHGRGRHRQHLLARAGAWRTPRQQSRVARLERAGPASNREASCRVQAADEAGCQQAGGGGRGRQAAAVAARARTAATSSSHVHSGGLGGPPPCSCSRSISSTSCSKGEAAPSRPAASASASASSGRCPVGAMAAGATGCACRCNRRHQQTAAAKSYLQLGGRR